MNRRALMAALLAGLHCTYAGASPETILTFDSFIAGAEVGSRFGAEVACSRHHSGSSVSSSIVVGAPNALAGEGQVQVLNTLNPAVATQILAAPSGTATRRFGTALEFIDDISGDGLDDLLVGAPGDEQNSVGQVFAYTSLYFDGAVRYVGCGSVSGPLGFATTLKALPGASEGLLSNFVVGNPRFGRVDGVSVTVVGPSACRFSLTGEFSVSRGDASQFGSSLAQVGALRPDGSQGVALLVAAAGEGGVGAVHQVLSRTPVASVETQGAPDVHQAGSIVSAYRDSSFYVVGLPRDNDARGSVDVYRSIDQTGPPYCSVRNPVEEYSGSFGSNVRLVGTAFRGLGTDADDVLALRYAEDETGGALALVGVNSSGCATLAAVNNCQRDARQEQGRAIAGGAQCAAWRNGREQRLLISGSPGWHEGRGRVDIAFEDGIRAAPLACPTVAGDVLSVASAEGVPGTSWTCQPNTLPLGDTCDCDDQCESKWCHKQMFECVQNPFPTGIPVNSSAGSSSSASSSSSSQFVESTPTYPTATPEPTVEALPTVQDVEAPHNTVGVDKGPSGSGVSQDQPIIVGPGTTGLPAPTIVVTNGIVEVTMPAVQPQLSATQRAKAIRELQKKGRLSKNRAAQLLDDTDNLVVTYIVHYVEVASSRRFAWIQSAYADGAGRRTTKARQIRSRRNDVTLRTIRPGTSVRMYYTVEISTKKPRSVIGVSQPSAAVTFTVP